MGVRPAMAAAPESSSGDAVRVDTWRRMRDPQDRLDLSFRGDSDHARIPARSDSSDENRSHGAASASLRGRPWISIWFECCSTYARVYRNQPGDAYHGQCPRCGAAVQATVGPGGTSSRFFRAS